MRLGITLAVIFAFIDIASAQTDAERERQALEIRDVIVKSTADGPVIAKGVRYDLRIFKGKIMFIYEDSFTIRTRNRNNDKILISIPYDDVIEIEIEEASLSFFPDPQQKPFAEWAAVKKYVHHGDSVDIDLVDKEQLFGTVLKTSDSDLTIMQGNKILVVEREKVARILLARRDPPEAKKVLRGAGKGAASTGNAGGTGPAAALGQLIAIVASTGAGAIEAASKRFPNDRLLIYSR